MSSPQHKTHTSSKHEHGTLKSYVFGFILSLIFTLIPYYLVVNKTITGNALLLTILGYALMQMIVQVTFFLHLGRGPKPKWNLFFFISTVGIILVVVGGSIVIISNLHYNMAPSEQIQKLVNDEGIYQIGGQLTGACQGQHDNYQVTIKGGQVIPLRTLASKCDTLTFINQDSAQVDINFGSYPTRGVYAGQTNLIVKKGQNQTISLSESGSYQFHDQLNQSLVGSFTVSP